jgi:microcystin-dependent protein
MTLYKWLQASGSNANVDSNVNWAEGQAPSSVNDSARGMMAAIAKYRDDIAGAIVTAGTSTAYTVLSYEVFDTLAHLNGQVIAFVPHATSTNAAGIDVTLNVDSLGAKSVRMQPGVALPAGSLILGTPYLAVYNNSDGVFYLRNMTSPYVVPLAAGFDFWGATTPNSCFAFPIGQAISRTTYATLFALLGTTYGVGDGSTTFNLPDKTGRVSAMKEASATRLTSAGSGIDGGTIGAAGGAQNITMARANLPNTSVPVTITDPGHTHAVTTLLGATVLTTQGGSEGYGGGGGNHTGLSGGFSINSATTGISAAFNLNNNVSQTAMIVAQPTIVCNYIIRVL